MVESRQKVKVQWSVGQLCKLISSKKTKNKKTKKKKKNKKTKKLKTKQKKGANVFLKSLGDALKIINQYQGLGRVIAQNKVYLQSNLEEFLQFRLSDTLLS